MGILVDTARAAITSLKRRANELAATALLEEALRVLRSVAAPHWRGDSIADVPEMIRELAQDRDDFRKMAAAYREDLTKAEATIRTHEDAHARSCNCAWEHHTWCNAYADWRKEIEQ